MGVHDAPEWVFILGQNMQLRTEGVTAVEFDLERGLVIVKVKEGVTLTEAQLKQLVDDAGFTLRSVSEQPL